MMDKSTFALLTAFALVSWSATPARAEEPSEAPAAVPVPAASPVAPVQAPPPEVAAPRPKKRADPEEESPPYWGRHLAAFRFQAAIGVYEASFSQVSSAQSLKLYTPGAFAIELPLGFRIGPVFLEYNVVWLTPSSLGGYLNTPPQSATSMDAAYWSFLGGNVGALLPIPYVTVELFTGIEDGNYGFVNGGSGSFGGVTVKAGFNLLYKFTSFGIGIKGEYRRLIVTQDKAGTPAAGVTSFADAFFIGLTTGFF